MVQPVELLVGALEEAEAPAELPFRLGAEGDVQRGDLRAPGEVDGALQERGPRRLRVDRRVRPDQEPRAGRRREGHGGLQLRVVLPAGPLPGMGPGVVEHVLAEGVALQVHGQRRPQATVAVLDDEMTGPPARLGRGRAALLEGGEEGVANEGVILARAGVPRRRGNLRDAGQHPHGHRVLFHVAHSSPVMVGLRPAQVFPYGFRPRYLIGKRAPSVKGGSPRRCSCRRGAPPAPAHRACARSRRAGEGPAPAPSSPRPR